MSEKRKRMRAPDTRAKMTTMDRSDKAATAMAQMHLRDTIAQLWAAGKSHKQICEIVERCESTVRRYVTETRAQILADHKDHFNKRLAVYFDDAFDVVEEHAALLRDPDFLTTADPERLKIIGVNFGIISDKLLIILAATRRSNGSGAEGIHTPGEPAFAGAGAG